MRTCLLVLTLLILPSGITCAAEADPQAVVKQVVTAAGGEAKLLKLFRIKERLKLGSDPNVKGSERTSVLEPPQYWWVGKRERVKEDKEPATFLVWAWTLGALSDPKSKIETIPAVDEEGKSLAGLRVSETITPPMDLYFNSDNQLVRIDWRSDIHRFSNWQEHDGAKYPANCTGYKKASGKPWYFTEILTLERLTELPEGLAR